MVAVVSTALGVWFYASTSKVKVASAFAPEDAQAIRRVVSRECWAEVRKSIAARNFRRVWHYALPILSSRIVSIAGFPGPPGGARVDCRGLLTDSECGFMVFNNTNGWNCDRISFLDASAMRQLRDLQRQYAAE